ncbi:MAG: 30S ribosomal protein S15 [Candidatus Cloacimonadota bacterium]|nr:MAG: 30S ribosomal protein S15 [Candidatus Cloacimonadota bacterium]PIE77598.1 MAG: 30S ribosomal protein S15 [Candidatus Delongbacteria bacterium]
MITKEKTLELVKKYGETEGDTGNPKVQIAILTERIKNLTAHLKDHKHDSHSRRGMRIMLGKRSSLLKYFKRECLRRERSNPESGALEGFKSYLGELGLKDRY